MSDVVEFHKYIDYRFADGLYPYCAGEVLESVYDEKRLIEFKMSARALHGSIKWSLCESKEMTIKIDL